MGLLERLRAETDSELEDPFRSWAEVRDALAAERAAVDAELDRLRAWLENVSWRLSQVLRLRDKSDPWSRVELIRDDAREAALAGEGEAPFSDERVIDDTDRLRFIVESNWIATKIRCRFGIQDGNLDSAREAIDRQIETRRLP